MQVMCYIHWIPVPIILTETYEYIMFPSFPLFFSFPSVDSQNISTGGMCYNLHSLVVSFTYVSHQSSGLLIGTVQISVDSQNISTESSGLLILLSTPQFCHITLVSYILIF